VTEAELLRAVLDSYDDDEPRLAYAAWLGGPRGEFIALQCEIDRLPQATPQLEQREAELWKLHGPTWQAELGNRGTFRRGFAYAADADMTGGDPLAMLERAPIAHLYLGHAPRQDYLPVAVRLAGDPRLARLRSVTLGGHLGERAFTALMSGPSWHALRGLETGEFRPYAARAIATSSLAQLAKLRIHYGPDVDPQGRDEAAGILAGAANLATLRLLSLGTCRGGVRSLASSSHLTGLRHLELQAPENHRIQFEPDDGTPSPNRLAADAAAALAASRGFAELVRLKLRGHAIGDAGVTALAQSAAFPVLTTLELRDNSIGDDGLRALAAGDGMPMLETLSLEANPITLAGITALVSAPRFARIVDLSLANCSLGPEAAIAIARSPYATGLRTLDLTGVTLGDDGARALAESSTLANLRGRAFTERGEAILRRRFGRESGSRAERRFIHAMYFSAWVTERP
jgi:uncharacterized protein (TIGR02996 family)